MVSVLSDGVAINGHNAVDLGLPSGIKWATCNVGAKQPSDCGNYYAWGELQANKSDYSDYTYKVNAYRAISGDVKYDAARKNWGGKWRMPTLKEFEELEDHCMFFVDVVNGQKGCVVTGPNGNSIFFPFSECRYRDNKNTGNSTSGDYWSGDKGVGVGAFHFYLNDWYNIGVKCGDDNECIGRVIRTVKE